MPLMDVIGDMGSYGMVESSEEIQPNVMFDRELKEIKERLDNPFKGGACPYWFIYLPFGGESHKGSF